mgnify:CR=1 FL=1
MNSFVIMTYNDTTFIQANINKIIQNNIVKNAKNRKWIVEQIDRHTIILKKNTEILFSDEVNTDSLIDVLLDIQKFNKLID